jgi:DUF3071 family protein
MPGVIKLRLIGASADLGSLIYTSQKSGRKGSHIAPIDDKLYDVLEDIYRKKKRRQKAEAAVKKAAEPRVEPKIPPRDIQKLLRAGRTPDAIAKMAGVPVASVERFLRPVLDEQLGIIQEFQTLRFTKPRLGESGASIGEAVTRNLRTRHVELDKDELADSWGATRTDGNPWIVSLRFRARGREHRASWRFDPLTRMIVAGNPLAADLAYVAGGRARPEAPAGAKGKAAARKTKSARKPASKRRKARTRRKPTAKRKATARRKPTAKRKVARKAKPKRRTTRTAARRSSTKKRTSRAQTSRSRSRRR